MTIGEKIRRIRKFRHMKQRELAVAIGLDEKSVSRIGQYEIGYRIPQKETLEQISRALNVNILNFVDSGTGSIEDLMMMLFWMEETDPSLLKLFQLKRFPNEKCNTVDDSSVYYHDSDSWPAHEPMGFWFNNTQLCSFIREWQFQKQKLISGDISREEYFEWKLNWPYTSTSHIKIF